jgi:superfamily II DNA or RNA helicase
MLIERGILAKPFFKFIPIGPKQQATTLRVGTAWQKAEEIGIVTNHYRNKCICAEVIRASRWGLTSMVLVKRQKHGKILHEMLQQYGLRGAYIFGESDKKKRDDALQKLRDGRYDYVIGSTILDVGVDVPGIGVLVLGGGGKAEVAIRQRIGRGLRGKKPPMPNFAFVVDFEDGHNKHLIKHAKQRRAIVEQTPGFVEGIMPRGKDFDFGSLGFRPAAMGIAA